MRKLKRVLAWIGIILLAGLYVITFILGITGSPSTKNLLMASIVCTVIVPVLFYAMMLLARTMSWHLPGDQDEPDRPADAQNKGGSGKGGAPKESSGKKQ